MVSTSAVVLLPLAALTIVTRGFAQQQQQQQDSSNSFGLNDIVSDDQTPTVNTDFATTESFEHLGGFSVNQLREKTEITKPHRTRSTSWEAGERRNGEVPKQLVQDVNSKHLQRIPAPMTYSRETSPMVEQVSTTPVSVTPNKTEEDPDDSKPHTLRIGSKSAEIRPGQSEAADGYWSVQDRPISRAAKRDVLTVAATSSIRRRPVLLMMMKKYNNNNRNLLANGGHRIKRLVTVHNMSSPAAFKTRKKAKELIRMVKLSPMMFFYRAPLVNAGGASAVVENFPRIFKRSKKPPTFEIAKNLHKRRRFDVPQVGEF